jgi:hypothetical protein
VALIDIEYDGKVRRENRATSLRAEREGQGIDPSMNYSVKTLAVSGTANLKWRAMTAADLAAIQQLADTQHVYLPERPEVFAEKFELFRDGCLVLVQEGTIVGYCFSHPWLLH